MKSKKRLDLLIQEQNPNFSRNKIQQWIMQEKVLVNDIIVTKPGAQYVDTDIITVVASEPKYVSRAGCKLEKALQEFDIDVTGLVVLDAGLSTGGFTDCLLQAGAAKVYGVDVGTAQVHNKIATNNRVVVLEKTNLRHVESVGQLVDLVTLDLSFISVLKVMDAVKRVLKPGGKLIVLIKPQFEGGKLAASSGGVVRDEQLRQAIVTRVYQAIVADGFVLKGITESPLLGAAGNKEFLAYFQRNMIQE